MPYHFVPAALRAIARKSPRLLSQCKFEHFNGEWSGAAVIIVIAGMSYTTFQLLDPEPTAGLLTGYACFMWKRQDNVVFRPSLRFAHMSQTVFILAKERVYTIKSGTCILAFCWARASLLHFGLCMVSRCFCTWFCCFSVAGSIGFAISRCLVVYQMLLYGISTSYKNISSI